MTLNDILQKVHGVKIVEQRSMTDDYCELVFLSKDLGAWHHAIAEALGEPRKPAGITPTEADQDLTTKTGGIWVGQTLFEKNFDKSTIIAKFWPWQDNTHITLKMAVLYH